MSQHDNEFENLCDLEVSDEDLALTTGGSAESDALAAAVIKTRMINLGRLQPYHEWEVRVTGTWSR